MKQVILSAFCCIVSCVCYAQKEENHRSFVGHFSDFSFKNFRYGSTGNKADFKFKSGVNSLTETGAKMLMFKIDPQDSAGAGRLHIWF